MKHIIITLVVLTLIGCNGKQSANDTIDDTTSNQECHHGRYVVEFENITVPFFGKSLLMDDSTHIMRQIAEIAADDKMLSVERKVLTVGEVGFGINLYKSSVVLISTTQVDDPKVKDIVKYINGFYGAGDEDDPDTFLWSSENDYLNIRLRPLHSDEGGTVLIFSHSLL